MKFELDSFIVVWVGPADHAGLRDRVLGSAVTEGYTIVVVVVDTANIQLVDFD